MINIQYSFILYKFTVIGTEGMALNAKMRQRIDGLIGIYLNALEAHKSGWNDRNAFAAFEEYQGELPSTAARWRASDFVLNQANQLRGQHAKLPLAVFLLGRVKACTCGGSDAGCNSCSGLGVSFSGGVLKEQSSLALIGRIYYSGATAKEVAEKIGMSESGFARRLTKAREEAAAELEKIDLLTRLLAAERQPSMVMS